MLGLGLVLFLNAASGLAAQDDDRLPTLVAMLESEDTKAAAKAFEELLEQTDPERRQELGRALLKGFGERPTPVRRARARLLAKIADGDQVEEALALLDDANPSVRRALLPLCARPDLSRTLFEERIAALENAARGDSDSALRRRALELLGSLDDEVAVAALGRLVADLPAGERAFAAESLPPTQRSAALIDELVARGFHPERPADRTPDDVLAAVLPQYARHLADADGGGERSSDRAPLILGLRHPSFPVRRAAARAFDALLARMREMGESDRALRVLSGLSDQGLERRVVHYHRARLALFPGGDPTGCLLSARAIRGVEDPAVAGAALAAETSDPGEARLWLFRSLYLEGIAELADGESERALDLLRRSAEVLDASLAERGDLGDEAAQWDHVDVLHQRALAEISIALARLAEGDSAAQRDLLVGLRYAHTLSLEAQVLHARLAGEALTGWDALLDTDLSPYRLLFTGIAYPGLSLSRGIELQSALGQALASVAPRELPGFRPITELEPPLSDPLSDPRRFGLLQEVQYARLEGITERIDELTDRVARRGGTGWEIPEEEISELQSLDLRRRILQDQISRAGDEGWTLLLEMRVPGSSALWLARDLRNEARGAEAREVARRMKTDLERDGISNWWYYLGVERLVRADMVIGSSYTDDDEPQRAEEALKAAVERLEALERRLTENGAGSRDLSGFRMLRANALVSLAVNANVKLGRSDEALEYYEQAYELRQDDFMRVLLACYRARQGRGDEARDLLREVRPGPQTWYNIACTYALLGETQTALEFLEKELEENHPSEASRQRQREWAAGDPDLASLRGDPRFEELVRAR